MIGDYCLHKKAACMKPCMAVSGSMEQAFALLLMLGVLYKNTNFVVDTE